MKYLLPIARAGVSLGITTFLIKSGIIDYDVMLNWEKEFLDSTYNKMFNKINL